jgi:hypothetical protein
VGVFQSRVDPSEHRLLDLFPVLGPLICGVTGGDVLDGRCGEVFDEWAEGESHRSVQRRELCGTEAVLEGNVQFDGCPRRPLPATFGGGLCLGPH